MMISKICAFSLLILGTASASAQDAVTPEKIGDWLRTLDPQSISSSDKDLINVSVPDLKGSEECKNIAISFGKELRGGCSIFSGCREWKENRLKWKFNERSVESLEVRDGYKNLRDGSLLQKIKLGSQHVIKSHISIKEDQNGGSLLTVYSRLKNNYWMPGKRPTREESTLALYKNASGRIVSVKHKSKVIEFDGQLNLIQMKIRSENELDCKE